MILFIIMLNFVFLCWFFGNSWKKIELISSGSFNNFGTSNYFLWLIIEINFINLIRENNKIEKKQFD